MTQSLFYLAAIMANTAIVIGATGLVGSELIDQLISDDSYEKIKVFHRRETGWGKELKVEEYIVDFEQIEEWSHLITGDTLFSSLGTTLKTAGSKEEQYKVDFTYQFKVIKAAAMNKVKHCVLVSSIGANASSNFFYIKMKGELEEAIKPLPFYKTIIVRPAFLDGDRKEHRLGEKLGIKLFRVITNLPGLKQQRPIHVSILSEAMRQSVIQSKNGISVYSNLELFQLAKK